MRREKVAVLTQATLTDQEMLSGQPEASYLMALAELPVPGALAGQPWHAPLLQERRAGGSGRLRLLALLRTECQSGRCALAHAQVQGP